jgi:hypothetical protein
MSRCMHALVGVAGSGVGYTEINPPDQAWSLVGEMERGMASSYVATMGSRVQSGWSVSSLVSQ